MYSNEGSTKLEPTLKSSQLVKLHCSCTKKSLANYDLQRKVGNSLVSVGSVLAKCRG